MYIFLSLQILSFITKTICRESNWEILVLISTKLYYIVLHYINILYYTILY